MEYRKCNMAAIFLLLFALTALLPLSTMARKRHRRFNRLVADAGAASPFGVNAHIPTTSDFKRMYMAGISWARIDLTWDVIEPKRGLFRWDIIDRVVMDAKTYHVHLLGILGYCPPWASSGPGKNYPPGNISNWTGFVSQIVGRYKGRINYWSLWNEPNAETFFRGTVNQFIQEVFIPAAKAAKAANPDCRIVGPDLAQLSRSHWSVWLNTILKRAGPYIDVISQHCYKKKPGDVLKALDGKRHFWESRSVRSIIKRRHQADKPFWLTEVGWRSTEIGEKKQAGYIISLLKGIARRPWIKKVFIFELRDSPGLPGYGLLRQNGSPKYSYEALKGFIATANGAYSSNEGQGR